MKRPVSFAIAATLALLPPGLDLRAGDVAKTKVDAGPRSGIDLTNIDPSVRPQDDLFRHVNGKWLDKATIPADRPADGAFYQLIDKAQTDVRAIIEKCSARPDSTPGSEERKVGDLYTSFMDEDRAEQLGRRPIQDDLTKVAAIDGKSGLLDAVASLQREGIDGLFGIQVDTDAKQSDQYILYLAQGGIGLPDESYYREAKFREIRDAYLVHIRTMFAIAGAPRPEEAATSVLALETRLARAHWDRVKSRDETLTYNKKDRAELARLTPGFEWTAWFEGIGAKGLNEIVVRQPEFFTAMAEALDSVPLADWKAWLSWSVIRNRAPLLSHAFVDEEFAFTGRKLTGTPENRPRWKRGVATVERSLGEAVGKLYVAEHFTPASKVKMQELVQNLVEAYRRDIKALDWMGSETKKKALQKLDRFTPKIGYPDRWRDYSALEIHRDDLVGNVRRATAFEFDRNLAKLGRPVDRSEWHMTPQTVNAYYNPGMNEIVFPAAILQPPFFDLMADPAVNYGGIGAVIGHEIGHGFDDQGSKFDGEGNLIDWWTDADRREFDQRAKKLIEQYNAFEPAQLAGQHVNGALTIGENIGDLGGLTIAYKAYKIALDGKEAPVIDSLTGDQRLFFGWAQIWRGKYRDAALTRSLAINPHSPLEFRCNGVVRNLPEFYEVFGVKEGDRHWLPPERRVRIW